MINQSNSHSTRVKHWKYPQHPGVEHQARQHQSKTGVEKKEHKKMGQALKGRKAARNGSRKPTTERGSRRSRQSEEAAEGAPRTHG
jgi:hypothetical protein